MKQKLLKIIVCPYCKISFKCDIFFKNKNEIIEGKLICKKCGRLYLIEKGIPRILPDKLTKIKEKTARGFAYEWKKFSKFFNSYEKQFLDWIYPVKKDFFNNKLVLDVGCGKGRHVYFSAKFGAKEVVGIDLSESVDIAYQNLKDLDNAHIIQADIYFLPFREKQFDYAYSIGVLHHLPEPEQGFKEMVRFVKNKGFVSAWVYGREGNMLLKLMNPIRKHILSNLPLSVLSVLSFIIMLFLHPFFKLLYKPLNEIKITKKIAGFLPQNDFFYYLSNFSFKQNHSILFDQFLAPVANYYTKEEFKKWFANAKLRNIQITWRNKNSWRGFAEKQ